MQINFYKFKKGEDKKMKKEKISFLQLILIIIFTISFLISNIIATKQIILPFNITMTSAIILFPIVYVLSDVFSEVYGYKWSRNTRYIAFFSNFFMVLIFTIAIKLPSANTFTGQEAMIQVLGSTPKVLFASLIAYFVGDFVNDKVFEKMKQKKEGLEGFKTRAIVSSILGELVDSFIFLPIIFMSILPIKVIIIMAITQALLKVSYEVLILPITTFVIKKIIKYEENN